MLHTCIFKFTDYHWAGVTAVGLVVPRGIIRPVPSTSVLTLKHLLFMLIWCSPILKREKLFLTVHWLCFSVELAPRFYSFLYFSIPTVSDSNTTDLSILHYMIFAGYYATVSFLYHWAIPANSDDIRSWRQRSIWSLIRYIELTMLPSKRARPQFAGI